MTAARPTVVIGCVAKDVSRAWPKLPATLHISSSFRSTIGHPIDRIADAGDHFPQRVGCLHCQVHGLVSKINRLAFAIVGEI